MKNTYFPAHAENRMKNEGNVQAARDYFFSGKNRVLYHLLNQRFNWMNDYIKDSDKTIIELGCGAGLSKEFIKNKKLLLTDVTAHSWVDKYVDALNIDYPDSGIDVIICSHMIHHIANPAAFLDHVYKKLKPGGRLIIQDIYTCTLMKCALKIMRHEGWSDTVNIYDRTTVCNDPNDPWSANCSIPKLLFFNKKFESEFPYFKILKKTKNECFLFFASGGVIAKTGIPPFPSPFGDMEAGILKLMDKILVKILPGIFACGCSIVLEK